MDDTATPHRSARPQAPGSDAEAAWSRIAAALRASVPLSTYQLWLEPLRPLGIGGETLHLTGPEGVCAWAERRYAGLIAEVVAETEPGIAAVSFSPPPPEEPSAATALAGTGAPNPQHTFERFVIGEGNRLAHGAALAVAEAPSEAYNPLFLYGPPGLGKTHLLGAIANYLRQGAPELNVRFTTAEGFTNEFVASLQQSGAEAFKQRYRSLDVLLIDDVQFLEGKRHTEEEFFHTFNTLYEAGSQLVLSADRIPSQLSDLADRLRDRFEWGLTTELNRPNLATRLTVLRRLAMEANLEIAEAGLAELARRLDLNIRQLHGALTRAVAHASLLARPLDSDLVAEVAPAGPAARRSDPEPILAAVAARFALNRAELIGPGRSRTEVRARGIAAYLIRQSTPLSLPQIGRLFGGRDHSTVLNAIRRVESALPTDPELAEIVTELRQEIHRSAGDTA
ncbi:MAG: chromosomal replication initiator protein DnaA [Solirubrobacterales bacterium]